jgi:dipeptidyl aminopeptidase/acylaminoacyl peptidase
MNTSYQLPPREILELADAPKPPSVMTDRSGKYIIMLYRNRFITLCDLMEKELRLAGIRIDPVTNSPSRSVLYHDLQMMKTGEKIPRTPEGFPAKARIDNVTWSPDQKKLAFTQKSESGIELWCLDLETEKCTRLTGPVLNANIGRPFTWFKNSFDILVKILPSDRKPLIDKTAALPAGPVVSESEGILAQNPTYQDLLKDQADEFNFTQLSRSELWKVNMSGQKRIWKDTAQYTSINFSSDGHYVLVSTLNEPYSYMVPMTRFPTRTDICDSSNGDLVRTILERPLLEELPKGNMAVEKGMRNVRWRDDQPATLVWVEALDEGDPAKNAEFRDEVFELPAPFNGKPRSILKTIYRLSGIVWGNEKLAVATDRWWNNRNTKSYLFNPSDPGQKPVIRFDRNYQDQYNNPGEFITEINEFGEDVLIIDGKFLYLNGPGFSEKGMRPFIDKLDYLTGKTTRIWQADGESTLEQITAVLDVNMGIVITSIQSQTTYPNLYLRNIHKKQTPQQITFLENPYRTLEKVYKEVITYKRDDGVELSAILYLPDGYDREKKEKLPMLMWAYPQEFKDASTAGQITTSPHLFTSIGYGSPLYWVTRGYAILDNTAFPVIGEGSTEPNDTFVEQLIANATAAIDAVDRLGYIDRTRLAVGGHSYGAFMTANLLTHSNLFAAGIARSGAYNRTLTPFGFQNEERNYWEAPAVYNSMSPFMNADKMKTPLLLIHGEADNNTGTFPLQSERYFNALKGLGGTARLVILPGESHGYAARENILHMLWETDRWLEKWVKNSIQ